MRLTTAILSIVLFLNYSCNTGSSNAPDEGMTLRLELFTSDMKKSVDFYTRILDFTMEGKQINYSYQPVKRGNVIFGIGPLSKLSDDHHFNPNLKNIQKGYGVEIVLEVDNVAEVYEKVKASGYPVEVPLTTQSWGLTDFRVVDPDGYYLRITSK